METAVFSAGRGRLATLALAGALVAILLAVGPGPQAAQASSHREAPLIAADPTADNTDLYAFVSPDRPDTVTIVANYIPFEEPAGGPNFSNFDENALYELHVDNDGNGRDDVTYQFRFDTKTRNGNTFLYNTGPITSLDDADWNVRQTYSVTRVQNHRRTVLATGLASPPANIGPRSTPSYDSLASAAVNTLPGGIKVFAGQRDDPFFVDLGSIFDLGGLRPFNPFHLIPLPAQGGVDDVAGYNVHSIAIQVPTAQLVDASPTIGVYASASRPALRILKADGRTKNLGPDVQISRLGNPLVNEVLIPLGQKDYWNRQDPEDDRQFVNRYLNPELAGLVNLLYPALPDTPTTNRKDLVSVLLTGVPTLNFTGSKPSDMLRLNTSIPPTAAPNRLGVLGGDFGGFPNGRRLADDVTDIELRAIACGYGPILKAALGLCDLQPNDQIGDGVDANDKAFMSTFPYVAAPHQGYDSHTATP
ncbi:MAG TPA: DUF4331 domain-containing protein [Gaiellaceae bacterium]|jgi:hypothetical protein|nr:DUF4331 domain-containing protein [Gaiellaceae bacterium]